MLRGSDKVILSLLDKDTEADDHVRQIEPQCEKKILFKCSRSLTDSVRKNYSQVL